jgi:hypothetical protein
MESKVTFLNFFQLLGKPRRISRGMATVDRGGGVVSATGVRDGTNSVLSRHTPFRLQTLRGFHGPKI